jgi:Family of unknown function (DUF5906)
MAKFDGAAISQADREFLASLDQHPLKRSAPYGSSCPPPLGPGSDEAAQRARFAEVVAWMLVNYAYCKNANMGKGAIVSLVDGGMVSIAAMRSEMQPYALETEGPRGGIHSTSPVDVWMGHVQRARIDGLQTRFDMPRPTFEEDGYVFFNRYRPPVHPTSGGEIETFEAFFARLIPDDTERKWFWNYLSHKARRPWVPMVCVIMVAEEFGTGRGTLFEILTLLFGKDYVIPCSFTELTGTSGAARFNDRTANALFGAVGEAVSEDGHQQAQRRLSYESLKNIIEPSPTARRRFEQKNQHAYSQPSAMTLLIATNHRDVIKMPRDDRRCCVLRGGGEMSMAERVEIRAWMAVPENIGALQRTLLETPAVPLEVFDPYGKPPPFAGRLEMIEMANSRIEDAFEEAMNVLPWRSLFTMTQAKKLIGYFGAYAGGDWSDRAQHAVTKNAYRLHEGRTRHNGRREIVYARTAAERRHWLPAEKAMVLKALDDTEARIGRIINTNEDMKDFATKLEEAAANNNSPPADEAANDD